MPCMVANIFPLEGHASDKVTILNGQKKKVRSKIILQFCSICEPANLRNALSMQNIAVCTGKQKKKYKIKKKIVVRTISLTTVGISSDISKLWSASVCYLQP